MIPSTSTVPNAAADYWDSVYKKTGSADQATQATTQKYGPPPIKAQPADATAQTNVKGPDYSFLQSVLNGALGGLGPFAQAGTAAGQASGLLENLQAESMGGGAGAGIVPNAQQAYQQTYQQELPKAIQSAQQYAEQNPLKSLAGNVAGGALLALIPPARALGAIAKPAWSATGAAGILARTAARVGIGGVFGAATTGVQGVLGQLGMTGKLKPGPVLADMGKSALAAGVASAVFGPVIEGLVNLGAKSAAKLQQAVAERWGESTPTGLTAVPLEKAIRTPQRQNASRLLYDATREAGLDLNDPMAVNRLRALALTDKDHILSFAQLVNQASPAGQAVQVNELTNAAGQGHSIIRQHFADWLRRLNPKAYETAPGGGLRPTSLANRVRSELRDAFGRDPERVAELDASIRAQKDLAGKVFDLARAEGLEINDPKARDLLLDPWLRNTRDVLLKSKIREQLYERGDVAGASAFQGKPLGPAEPLGLQDLHLLRQGIDDKLFATTKALSAGTLDPEVATTLGGERRVLRQQRAILTDLMNQASPSGAFQRANRMYEQSIRELEGLQLAKNALQKSPDDLAVMLQDVADQPETLRMFTAKVMRDLDLAISKSKNIPNLFDPVMQERLRVILESQPGRAEQFAAFIQGEQAAQATKGPFRASVGQQDTRKPGGLRQAVRSLGYLAGGNVFFGGAAAIQSAAARMEKGLLTEEARWIARHASAPSSNLEQVIQSLTARPETPLGSIIGPAVATSILKAPPGVSYTKPE